MTNLEIKELKAYLEKNLLPEIEKEKNKWEDNGELFYVGGAVRDEKINQLFNIDKKIKDIDLATNLTPEMIKNICLKMGITTIDTGITHGTVTLMIPVQNTRIPVEVTTFRKDVETDGRNATIEYARTIEEDLSRRDFTFNAMAISLKNKTLLDPFNGIEDINNKNIKFVGSGKDRILEDHLRMIRMIRFAFQLNFKFSKDYFDELKENFNINVLSKERIKMEMDKIVENLNENNFYLLNYLFSPYILNSDKNYEIFNKNKINKYILNSIENQNKIEKEDKKIIKYYFLIEDLDEKIIVQKIKFSNIEFQKLKNFKETIKLFNNKDIYDNSTNIKFKMLLFNKIDLNTLKNFSLILDSYNKMHNEDTRFLKELETIIEKKEPYSIKDLDITSEEVEYYLKLNLNGNVLKKEHIGKCLKHLTNLVIIDKNFNRKKLLIKEIKNYLIIENVIIQPTINEYFEF